MDYWDFVQQLYSPTFTGKVHNLYDMAYENSHGSTRYWLSKVPFFGKFKQYEDEAQYWQDTYDNTGKDPVYSTAYGNSNPLGAAVGSALSPLGVVRMARSLSDVYSPEVSEDLQSKHNNMYW